MNNRSDNSVLLDRYLRNEYLKNFEKAKALSLSANSYNFMELRSFISALNTIVKSKDKNEPFIAHQIILIDHIVNSSRWEKAGMASTQDDFKGWVSLNERGGYGREVVLYESYSFYAIVQFLFYLKDNGWVSKKPDNLKWWSEKVKFIEDHVWTKWLTRSQRIHNDKFRMFFRTRTHMGAHWAGIAMYLEKITSDPKVEATTKAYYNQYDKLLKSNMKVVGGKDHYYVWNSTYDLNKPRVSVIQDVSHGNHVVEYIVSAFEVGNINWTINDIKALCNTVKYSIYDANRNTFKDNLNGSNDRQRPGRGNFQADGWVKLSSYDKDVSIIYNKFRKNRNILQRYNQEFQFMVNFLQ